MRLLSFAISFRLAVLGALFLGSLASFAASGNLVTRTLQPFPDGVDRAERVIVQPDGKPIAIGMASFGTQQFAMTRYNTNGTIDTAYGASRNGTQLEPLGSGHAEAFGAAFDASGRLVVAGHVRSEKDRFAVARFNADGTLDESFGGGGSAISIGAGDSGGYAMAMQADGKILVGGYSMSGAKKVFTVVRYNANDTVDTAYGSSGAYVAAAMSSNATVTAMALQSDGKLVIAGMDGSSTLVLQRLTTSGTLDTTFGMAGTASLSGSLTTAWDMAVYPDNRVLVQGTGTGTTAVAIARFSAAGVLDNTFGTSGVATVAGGGFGGNAGGLVLQSDGTIVAAGTYATGAVNQVLIAKLTTAGALDGTFGTGGTTKVTPSGIDAGRGIAARAGGGYYVVGLGFLAASSVSDTEIVAFTANGALDTTFNATGFNLADRGSANAAANASALQPDGKVVVAGLVYASNTTSPSVPISKAVVARYNADGSLDTTFNSIGYLFVPALLATNAVAIDGSGRIVIGGRANTVVSGVNTTSMAFARITSSGTLDSSFGSSGVFTIAPATSHEEITSIAIQPSGRIVGAGFVMAGSFMDSAFVGVTSAGALDATFGSSGKMVVAISSGDDEVNGIALQSDGKIVGGGFTTLSSSQDGMAIVRLTVNGAPDTGFGAPNGYVTIAFGGNTARGYAVAVQPDGKILVGGKATTTLDNYAVARVTTTGALDAGFGTGGTVTSNFHSNHNRIFALGLTASGKIVGAGEDAGSFGVVQYLSGGTLDTAFGTGGESSLPINFMAGADYALSLNIAPNGNLYMAGNASNAFALAIVAGDATKAATTVSLASNANPSTTGQAVTLTATVSGLSGTPTGTVDFFDSGNLMSGCSSVPLSSGAAQCTTSAFVAGAHSITASYSGSTLYATATSGIFTQNVQAPAVTLSIAVSPSSIDFGGASMGTTSLPRTITVTNNGTGSVTINGVAASAQFAQTNDCTSLAPSAMCTITVTFNPTPQAGPPLNGHAAVSGSITITSSAASSPNTVALAGSAEKSLVTHYYESILRRAPDAGGQAFWEQEAQRMQSDGVNVNETWYAMAVAFFFSSEYLSLNRSDAGFVTDMYTTFFNRAPDSGGLSFWVGQLASGVPREVVLAGFMFSGEFTSFTQGVFGNTAARAEVDVVMDFYRGVLARLPDNGGLAYWVQQFRTAQCQGAGPVYSQANTISFQFLNGPEYAARGRTNAQFVGDLYNAFLRRGGDAGGVQYWVDQLNKGASREQVRQAFVNTPEFGNRVNAIVQQGCLQ